MACPHNTILHIYHLYNPEEWQCKDCMLLFKPITENKENHSVNSEPKVKYGIYRPMQKGDIDKKWNEALHEYREAQRKEPIFCVTCGNQKFCKKCWDDGKGCASCDRKDCPSNQKFCECSTKPLPDSFGCEKYDESKENKWCKQQPIFEKKECYALRKELGELRFHDVMEERKRWEILVKVLEESSILTKERSEALLKKLYPPPTHEI